MLLQSSPNYVPVFLLFEYADFPYKEVRTLNNIFVETAAFRAQSLVDYDRKFCPAIPAETYSLYPFDYQLRASQKIIIIGNHFISVLKELGDH